MSVGAENQMRTAIKPGLFLNEGATYSSSAVNVLFQRRESVLAVTGPLENGSQVIYSQYIALGKFDASPINSNSPPFILCIYPGVSSFLHSNGDLQI